MEQPLSFKLSFPARFQYLSSIHAFWKEISNKCHIDAKIAHDVSVVLEEHCTNIVRHAYREQQGTIKVSIKIGYRYLDIQVRDTGQPFDVSLIDNATMPDLSHSNQIGGMGLPLIKSLIDKVEYTRTPKGMNRWKFKKERSSLCNPTSKSTK